MQLLSTTLFFRYYSLLPTAAHQLCAPELTLQRKETQNGERNDLGKMKAIAAGRSRSTTKGNTQGGKRGRSRMAQQQQQKEKKGKQQRKYQNQVS